MKGCGVCFPIMADPYFRGGEYKDNSSIFH